MRTRRAVPAATTAALLLAAAAAPAAGQPVEPDRLELTLLATTDVHGHVYDWDYFRNAPFPTDDSLGLTRVATAVEQIRAEKGEDSVLLLDNGDAIQGTPLTYYYGMGEGRDEVIDDEVTHPMATAFNQLDYDVQVVGNHEYNYGLDLLEAYDADLDAPLLGANVIDVATGEPYHQPYELVEREIDGETVTVGVLGLVTPGVRIWDKQHVEGVLEFQDMVTAAERWVPEVDAQADVVVVIAHTGLGNVENDAYDPTALHEDVTNNIAHFVPGIDVIVAGHTHEDRPQEILTNVEGDPVLMTQPDYWARSLTEMTLGLVPDGEDGWQVDWSEDGAPTAVAHRGTEYAEDEELRAALADEHAATVEYVNTPVAESVTELLAETSRYEDTPIIDFINHVQQTTLEAALSEEDSAGRTVISQASPFSRDAVFPEGEVTIADIAGLYIYENTLTGVVLTGAELRDYLEFSARYFNQVEEGAEFDPETGTNAVYPDRPSGVPDYNYDVISGLEYVIDISQPVGERIAVLTYPDGTPVADDDEFVMAVNNYRQSGGGAYPHVADAELVYDERLEIRQLLIEWAQERGVIDPADFFVENWWLVTEPLPEPEPTTPGEEPSEEPSTAQPSPTTPPPSPGATTPPPASGPGRLPSTGAPVIALVGLALLGVAGGATALVARRRTAA